MIDSTAAIATTHAASQTQAGLLALRLADESQRQIVTLLTESVARTLASNPAHLGSQIDTYA